MLLLKRPTLPDLSKKALEVNKLHDDTRGGLLDPKSNYHVIWKDHVCMHL